MYPRLITFLKNQLTEKCILTYRVNINARNFLRSYVYFIEPVSGVIGSEYKIVKQNKLKTLFNVDATAIFIPTICVKLFEIPNLLNDTKK